MRTRIRLLAAAALLAPALAHAQFVEVARYAGTSASGDLTLSAFRDLAGTNSSGQQRYRYYFAGTVTPPSILYVVPPGFEFTRFDFSGRLVGSQLASFPLFSFSLPQTATRQPLAFTSGEYLTTVATLPDLSGRGPNGVSAFFSQRFCTTKQPQFCDQESAPLLLPAAPLAVVAPEPATWALLGTGLVSLGVGAARRRPRG